MTYRVVTPDDVAASRGVSADTLLLDVRTPEEFRWHRIPGAVLVPLGELSDRCGELDPRRPTLCICEHGIRSERAAEFLSRQGFIDVATMSGGMARWPGPVEKG